jgi:glycosyl transferase, family 25
MPYVTKSVRRLATVRPRPLATRSRGTRIKQTQKVTTTTTVVTRTTQVTTRPRVMRGRFLRVNRPTHFHIPKPEPHLNLPWFPEITAAFAISMRPNRWRDLKDRLGPWAAHVKMWEATNGYNINVADWVKRGKTVPNVRLTRGQLGCHDSHVKLWKHIVQNQIPMTLILEDDATLVHTQASANIIRKALDDCKTQKIPWHILYLGRQRNEDASRYSGTLSKPRGCCGLFAYILTLEGAQKLVQYTGPYHKAVDVLVANFSDQGKINCVALNPRLVWVTSVTHSDTNGIR